MALVNQLPPLVEPPPVVVEVEPSHSAHHSIETLVVVLAVITIIGVIAGRDGWRGSAAAALMAASPQHHHHPPATLAKEEQPKPAATEEGKKKIKDGGLKRKRVLVCGPIVDPYRQIQPLPIPKPLPWQVKFAIVHVSIISYLENYPLAINFSLIRAVEIELGKHRSPCN
ncbi:hypothetical protein Pfo_028325 [Paulownia fortunei]|nr:hypothetical protein Pfo_028325 [Paulownia fortunei]